MEKKKKARLIYNIIMAAFVLYAWLIMFFNKEDGMLTARGFVNLKFFTTLSNIFAGAVAVVWIADHLKKKDSPVLALWKLMSASAVGVTFMVVLGFLGPLYGFGTMYTGSNLFFHLVVPLMAMVEYVFFNEKKMKLKDNLCAIFPPLVYGTVYVINTLINGVKGNDIYGFLNWGYPIGFLIFAAICLVAFLIGLLLRFFNAKVIPAQKQEGI